MALATINPNPNPKPKKPDPYFCKTRSTQQSVTGQIRGLRVSGREVSMESATSSNTVALGNLHPKT